MKLRYISSIHVERKMLFSRSLTLNHKYLYTHVSIGHQLRFATNFASPTNYNKTENLSKWIEDYTEFLVQLEKQNNKIHKKTLSFKFLWDCFLCWTFSRLHIAMQSLFSFMLFFTSEITSCIIQYKQTVLCLRTCSLLRFCVTLPMLHFTYHAITRLISSMRSKTCWLPMIGLVSTAHAWAAGHIK